VPYVIKECRLEPHPNFPIRNSLFLPCNNFQGAETTGFLCAVKTDEKKCWNLGILQHVNIVGDFKSNSYEGFFLVFKKGTSWDAAVSGLEKYMKSKQVQYILKYVEPKIIRIDGHGMVPLVEVTRYMNNEECLHFHLSPKDKCFEQPKEGPQAWWTASGNLFKQLFGERKTEVLEGSWKRNTSVILSSILLTPAETVNCDHQVMNNRKRNTLKVGDAEQVMLDFASSMKIAKVIDVELDDCPIPIYYVHQRSPMLSDEKKYVLFPYSRSKDNIHTRQFAKIAPDKVPKLCKALSDIKYNEYDDLLEHKKFGECVELYNIDPSKHPRGFAVALLNDSERPPPSSTEVFSSSTHKIFRENRRHVFHDFQLQVGTVVYRGLPWMFDIGLKVADIEFVEHMHGNESRGLPHVRNGVHNFGFFSYTGPRASSQSSASPVEENSCGHDLYTKNYRPAAYAMGLKIGNVLCSQSDKMIDNSGNTAMKLAMCHNLTQNKRKRNHNYSAICHNRIITKWFASVSGLRVPSVFCLY
jgi:hypothetical protein